MEEKCSGGLAGSGLILAGAILVAAKIWGGLDWPWWVVTAPSPDEWSEAPNQPDHSP